MCQKDLKGGGGDENNLKHNILTNLESILKDWFYKKRKGFKGKNLNFRKQTQIKAKYSKYEEYSFLGFFFFFLPRCKKFEFYFISYFIRTSRKY